MQKLLVCQHVPFEILGTLNPLLRHAGFRMRYVNFGRQPDARPELDGYSGLVILGGPMSAYEVEHGHLATEVGLIRTALDRELPVLGICLGAQLIAKALGATVRPNRVPEIGWYGVSVTEEGGKDPLFAHFDDNRDVVPMARGHVPAPEESGPSGDVACLPQPGVSLWRPRVRLSVSPGGGQAADRALAQRPGAQGRAQEPPAAHHPGTASGRKHPATSSDSGT